MRHLLASLLLLLAPLAAQAGQGTIEETDDAIIVEYTGDAADKSPPVAPEGMQGRARQAAAKQEQASEANRGARMPRQRTRDRQPPDGEAPAE